MFEIKPWENQNLEVNIFELTRKILTTINFWAYMVFPLPKTLVKTLAKNLVKNLAKNLTKTRTESGRGF